MLPERFAGERLSLGAWGGRTIEARYSNGQGRLPAKSSARVAYNPVPKCDE